MASLIELGCEVNATDSNGTTPLMLAVKSFADGNITSMTIKHCLNHGADSDIKNSQGLKAESLLNLDDPEKAQQAV